MIAFVEARVRVHLNDISLPQIVVSSDYDAPWRKISSRRRMQFLVESTSIGVNFFLSFSQIFFHDSTRNTQSKRIFFLTDTTRLTRIYKVQENNVFFLDGVTRWCDSFHERDLIYNKTSEVLRWSIASRCHEYCCLLDAKRRAIVDDPSAHWNHPSALIALSFNVTEHERIEQ